MRVQLAPQAQDLLGPSDLVSITERVDDVALRIGQMVKMGFVEGLDRHLPQHWKPRRISWGWTAVIWLADLLTAGDHRKGSVAASINGLHHPLRQLTGQIIEPLDFRDDRVGHLLSHLCKPTSWQGLEADVTARSSAVSAVRQDVLRGDATTVSGAHDVTAGGLVPFGPRKDAPTRPPINVMRGSLEPLGMPLATAVLAGERADGGVDIPRITRIAAGLSQSGWLFVGDGKRSAWDTRAHRAGHQHVYWSPLP